MLEIVTLSIQESNGLFRLNRELIKPRIDKFCGGRISDCLFF